MHPMVMKIAEVDESELSIPVLSPVCTFCARLIVAQGRRCSAFRNADIPMEIWIGENNHRRPYPGDHGLQFTPWNESQQEEGR